VTGGEGRGGAAIDRHVDAADRGPAIHRYSSARPRKFQGGTPLHAVTAHLLADPDHWHLVTYGLTEMHTKDTPDRNISGWGAELTLRVKGTEAQAIWAVDFLSSLAGYVWTNSRPFDEGHHIDLRGPMKLGSTTGLRAAALVADPGLDTLQGPFGQVRFLQVVGLHADELEACRAWSTEGVLGLLARDDPWWLADLERPSLLQDPAARDEIDQRRRGDGSSLTELTVGTLSLGRTRLRGDTEMTLGAGAAAALGPALRRELIGEGARFVVRGDRHRVRFLVADAPSWNLRGDALSLRLPLDDVAAVADIFTGRSGWGRHPAWPGVRFHVVA
jgi:suppressor of fused-like protein